MTVFLSKDNADVAVIRPAKPLMPGAGDLILAGVPIRFLTHLEPVEILDSLLVDCSARGRGATERKEL